MKTEMDLVLQVKHSLEMDGEYMQELLTIEQTMNVLQIKKRTIERLIKTPGFPAYKIGGSIRIGGDELEQWVKKQKI